MSENPALPKGDAPSAEPRETAVQSDFAAIVQESKEKIEGAEKKVPAVKGKRGRPKGSTKRPGVPSDVSSAPVGSETVASSSGAPPPDVSKILIPPIKAISKIPAVKFQIAELAFSEEEATACAESLNAILEAFVPDVEKMSPKTAAVITAGVTFASIGFAKFQIYSNEMEKRGGKKIEARKAEVQATQNTETETITFPGNVVPPGKVDALDYFKKP